MVAATLARWRSGLTHIPFKDAFTRSNRVRVTNLTERIDLGQSFFLARNAEHETSKGQLGTEKRCALQIGRLP